MIKKIAIEEHIGGPPASVLSEKSQPYQSLPPKGSLNYLDGIETRIKDMDEAGISMQVLSGPLSPRNLTPDDATALSIHINDELSRVVAKYPERFAAFATISLKDVNAAARELERAIIQLGFKGTILTEYLGEDHLYESKFGIIWETLEKLDIPVYFHMGSSLEGVIGMGSEISLQVMGLISHGVFDVYPNLRIILGHLGEGIPFWLWRIDNRWQKDLGRVLESPESNLKKSPGQYFKDHFYVTTSGQFWLPAFQLVYSALGADNILFAVDYPPESCFEAAQFIDSVPVSDGDKQKICHLNVENLLKI